MATTVALHFCRANPCPVCYGSQTYWQPQPLCPEAEMRAAMTDAEFWEHVFTPSWERNPRLDQHAFGVDIEELELMTSIGSTCPECGQPGPCGYDAEGRPFIHIADYD